MLNPFLTTDAAHLDTQVREHWTQRLRQAMHVGQDQSAIEALAQGADPHAADHQGELLFAQAIERHHPRLVVAFCAVGGQYVGKEAPGGTSFVIQAGTSSARSRAYTPQDRAWQRVRSTFADFNRVAESVREDHTTTARQHPNRRVACDLSSPRSRYHALLSVMDILRQRLYGHAPLWTTGAGEPAASPRARVAP